MRLRSVLTVLVLLVAAGAAAWWLTSKSPLNPGISWGDEAQRGGRLIVTYRSEPTTHNKIVGARLGDDLLSRLTHAPLVRMNRESGEIEPRLADSWTSSPDGLTWTFKLRNGVKFSDGTPFTAADVVFTFRLLYDPIVESDMASTLRVAGQPLIVRALDELTVVVVFPGPYGPGISVLDAVPILPRHKLEAALEAGRVRDAWTMKSSLSDVAGLGPFRVREHVSGERMVFERNPHFWLRDAAGRPLPNVDEVEVQFVSDQNAETLRLQSGAADLTTGQVRLEDLAALRQLERAGTVRLYDAGTTTAPDAMWFNLNPDAAAATARPWIHTTAFRRAVSLAIDRAAIVNTVFLGEAVPVAGPVTPGHGKWFDPSIAVPVFDRAAAARELDAAGLTDRDGDGMREDASGSPARFSLMTQRGHSVRERIAAVVQEHLRSVGLAVDVVGLDERSLQQRFGAKDYDAILYGFEFDSFDPARHAQFWMSSGGFHVWRPGQTTPATTWEARIDDLMTRQATTLDVSARRRLFADAQTALHEQQPVLYFAAPRVILATSARVQGVRVSVLAPNILWNAEALSLATARH